MAASKWGELEAAAFQAEMVDWGGSWDRKARTRTLHPVPDAELVETERGPALKRPPAPEVWEGADPEGLLERFCRLSDAADGEILEYARRYGLLRLCEHGLPSQHPSGTEPPCTALREEPLSLWRRWSERARATLAVAAQVHQGKTGRPGDWVKLPSADRWPVGEESVETDRHVLGDEVDEWLVVTGARLRVLWEPDQERPTLEVGGFGLFQNLARDLALTVTRLDGLAVCDGCGTPYTPNRKPRSDRRSFCATCREAGVPARLRMRDRRERERGETDATS